MSRGIRDDMEEAFSKFESSFEDDDNQTIDNNDDDGSGQPNGLLGAAEDGEPEGSHDALEGAEDEPKESEGEPKEPDSKAASDKAGAAEGKQRGPKDSLKAPVDWSPKDREDWSRIPRHLQERILAREKHMATTMANTSEARKVADRVNGYRQTYGAIMAAEGVNDPMQAIDGMFQTVASLRMGTPAAKARIMADMINHYGVDVSALDDVLVGQEPRTSENPGMEAMQKLLDERLAPVNQLMQGLTAAQQRAVQDKQQQAVRAVEEFQQKAEFLNEVRGDMADLLDMATKRGQEMTLQQAYDKACALHPEISQVMERRKMAGGQHGLDSKRAAASSVNGRRGGAPGGPTKDGSIRSSILRAMDSVDR